jgi:hypothetical protein
VRIEDRAGLKHGTVVTDVCVPSALKYGVWFEVSKWNTFVFSCSAIEAEPGPPVIATASLAPVIVTEPLWLALVDASLTRHCN